MIPPPERSTSFTKLVVDAEWEFGMGALRLHEQLGWREKLLSPWDNRGLAVGRNLATAEVRVLWGMSRDKSVLNALVAERNVFSLDEGGGGDACTLYVSIRSASHWGRCQPGRRDYGVLFVLEGRLISPVYLVDATEVDIAMANARYGQRRMA